MTCSQCGRESKSKRKDGICFPCSNTLGKARKAAQRLAETGATAKVPTAVTEAVAQGNGIEVGRTFVEGQVLNPDDVTQLLHRDPTKYYRFVTEDPQHITRARAQGLKPVKSGEKGSPEAPFLDHGRPDGFIGFSGGEGMILHEGDRHRIEERRAVKAAERTHLGKSQHESEIHGAAQRGEISPRQAEKLLKEGYVTEQMSPADFLAREGTPE